MQLVDHDRDIKYLKDNPSPTNYTPVHVGKVLAKDSIKYSFQSKAHPVEFIEKKRNLNKPGPGKYLDRKNIDYFMNDIRFNNKLKNGKSSSFGATKRFSFPSKCQQDRFIVACPHQPGCTDLVCFDSRCSSPSSCTKLVQTELILANGLAGGNFPKRGICEYWPGQYRYFELEIRLAGEKRSTCAGNLQYWLFRLLRTPSRFKNSRSQSQALRSKTEAF